MFRSFIIFFSLFQLGYLSDELWTCTLWRATGESKSAIGFSRDVWSASRCWEFCRRGSVYRVWLFHTKRAAQASSDPSDVHSFLRRAGRGTAGMKQNCRDQEVTCYRRIGLFALFPCFLKKKKHKTGRYCTRLSIRLSVCLSVTLSPPKWMCRNSPNLLAMITTWYESSITLASRPGVWSKGQIPKKKWLWAHF